MDCASEAAMNEVNTITVAKNALNGLIVIIGTFQQGGQKN